MTKRPDPVTSLNRLIKDHQGEIPTAPEGDPVIVLIRSFLIWESTMAKADTAYERLSGRIVDFNDLRVSMPDELIDFIGKRYPRADERVRRLRTVLRDIYQREHDVSLRRLAESGKREIKKYLRTLDGIVPYVSDRVMLLCYGAHAIPADENLHTVLEQAGACEEGANLHELGAWLTRQIKAAEGVAAHFALQSAADAGGATAGRSGRSPAGRASAAAKVKSKPSPQEKA